MPDIVVVGMSGGVDSSVAAALLLQQGYGVIGVTLDLWDRESLVEQDTRQSACCSLDAVEDARRVANLLGIPHYTLNLRDSFRQQVIRDFAAEYMSGRTPNPCIRCNRYLKFGALLDRARQWGARYVATGHYARTERSDSGRYRLLKSRDETKDQSYALYSLTQEQLASTLFPLGEYRKEEVRAIASDLKLVTAAKPESQEICFVPNDDYASYLRETEPEAERPGPILDASGRLVGTHSGIAFFTVGQRRGLGLAGPRPYYVRKLIPEQNAVVVGEEGEMYARGLLAGEVNWVSAGRPEGALRAGAKVRYRSPEVPATVHSLPEGGIRVEFDQPQRAISPGQAVVLYDGDAVAGGGKIMRALE